MKQLEILAKQLYEDSTANDPIVHCNRFPAWDELSKATKKEWRKKAAANFLSLLAGKLGDNDGR